MSDNDNATVESLTDQGRLGSKRGVALKLCRHDCAAAYRHGHKSEKLTSLRSIKGTVVGAERGSLSVDGSIDVGIASGRAIKERRARRGGA